MQRNYNKKYYNMKLKKGFILRDICGDKVLVGEGLEAIDFGHLLSLNETATWLWQEAEKEGTFTCNSLTDALLGTYEVNPETAKKDVKRVIDKWIEENLIEE